MKEDPITFPCDRDCVTHHYACDCREAAHRRRVARLEAALRAIRDHKPAEVVKDAFAYDRMVENYRKAARTALEDD